MALKKTVVTPHGFEALDAYHRVENVSIEDKVTLAFNVTSYKEAQGFSKFLQMKHECSYDIQGDNPIRQAYRYLKTLPQFADATDC